jgi:hypothetical protein
LFKPESTSEVDDVPPKSRAMAPASANPFWAAVSVNV